MGLEDRILKCAKEKPFFTTRDVVVSMKNKFSRQYVQRIINMLVKDGSLTKSGSTKSSVYAHPGKAGKLRLNFNKTYESKGLQEHLAWQEVEDSIKFKFLLRENIYNILLYSFSEMLNNAIDHSQSKKIYVKVENKKGAVEFLISDGGIGVFNNVMKKFKHLKTPQEVVQELLKGKMTTDTEKHTGEGIFFTSKICDSFQLSSLGHQLVDDKEKNEYGWKRIETAERGTVVFCKIKKTREDTLSNLFKRYYTDPKSFAFDKTDVHVKLFAIGRACISRSQAKRVLDRLENFKKVILDFENVSTVGQGFADEIFRVYKNKHPEVQIEPINMHESVKFMVKRAVR